MSKWFESKNVKIKKDKVVVKLYNGNNFIDSCIIPTVYYPLNGKMEVFTCDNTEQVKDEGILKIFDSIKYNIGHCYSDTKNLVSELRKNGYNAKEYVGWLFTGENDYPVHHCWCVLDNSVLDLSDHYSVMLTGSNGEYFKEAKTREEQAYLMADFMKSALNVKNSIRCYPVGTPTPIMFYVGSECDSEEGRLIYQRLMKEFPNHKIERNCDNKGYNPTQRILKEQGLMK